MNTIHYNHRNQYNMPSTSTISYNSRPTTTRVASTTTEFRGSTNPDEDWTKISDLAERRRIQNRIAQRNYRKKLKRRLEDLERRAASRSLSPNGDDTDGRSTRESSAEGTGAIISVSPPSSEPHLVDAGIRENYIPAMSSAYTYSPAYSTASASYYPAITAPESYGASNDYLYSYSQPTLSSVVEATCGSSSLSSSGSDSGYLPVPGANSRSAYSGLTASPEMSSPKTPPNLYEETNMSPFYLPYAGLSDPPTDPSFYSDYYHHDHHSTSPSPPHSHYHIKSEPRY